MSEIARNLLIKIFLNATIPHCNSWGVCKQIKDNDMKKLILAAAIVVSGTSASLAQTMDSTPGYGRGYGGYDRGYYDYAPGYRSGPQGGYSGNHSARDDERGGPGPRVGPGSGMGIGSQR
jgi:hypothetical protein